MQFLTNFIANFFPQKCDFLSKFLETKEQGVGRCHFRCSRATSSRRFLPKWRNQLPARLCFHLLFPVSAFHKCFPLAVQLQAAAEKRDTCVHVLTDAQNCSWRLPQKYASSGQNFLEKNKKSIHRLSAHETTVKKKKKKKCFLIILFSLPRWLE